MIQEKQFYRHIVRKKSFTLIELVIGLAIGSLIIALIYNLLGTSLHLSSKTIEKLNRTDDIEYALNYMSDEVNASKYFIKNTKNLTFYNYDPNQSFHHRYCQYYVEDNKLYRAALHLEREQKNFRINKIKNGKNLILEDVESFEFDMNEEQLTWHIVIDGKNYEFCYWLRGK